VTASDAAQHYLSALSWLQEVAVALALQSDRRDTITCMSLIDVQRLFTVSDVAERLGLSRRTVQREIAQGEIPALPLGGKWSPIRVRRARARSGSTQSP
jgi:excisionase family DNA binding protein